MVYVPVIMVSITIGNILCVRYANSIYLPFHSTIQSPNASSMTLAVFPSDASIYQRHILRQKTSSFGKLKLNTSVYPTL